MNELNFEEYKKSVLNQISEIKNIVLATSADGSVTTRLVGQLLYDNKIAFSTSGNSFKVEQINKNPNVAFFLNGLNIEAEARLCGHPEEHPVAVEAYVKKYPEYVSKYGYEPDDVLVIADIKKVQIYTFTDRACKDIVDFKEERAYRIEL